MLRKHRFNVAREANKKIYVIMAMLAGAKCPDLAGRLRRLGQRAVLAPRQPTATRAS